MHIEKNVFDNIFNTVMNVKGKTKDNERARMNMHSVCIRGDLELRPLPNGKFCMPKAKYTLTNAEAKVVCEWVKGLKMPDGYASNLSRCADVTKGMMHGMKSHDCHIFMQNLIPIAFKSLPDFVWKPLTELSQFFKDICCNSLKVRDLERMESNIPILLCKLERIFPPAFFDSMEHLVIHLPTEARLGGPVQYRWMYIFERMMGAFKRAVTQKAKVEGSISSDYLSREITYFCSHYFKTFNLASSSGLRNDPMNDFSSSSSLSVCMNGGHPSGKPQTYWLSDKEWNSARVHILINCNEVKPFLDIFLTEHNDGAHRLHSEFPEWFKAYVNDHRHGVSNNELKALAWGPMSKVSSWNIYFVNGYKFHTRAWSNSKKTTNCGVCVKGLTECGEDDFYGIIEHIYELEYHGLSTKITLFYCQWYDPSNRGTRVHSQYKIVEVNKSRRYQNYDPFLIAQKAKQVYYVDYPTMCSDLRAWCVAIATNPRGHVQVDDIIEETLADDDLPYQANVAIIPTLEIEQINGLVDQNTSLHDVVDPIVESTNCSAHLSEELEEEIETDIDEENSEDDDEANEEDESEDDDGNWGGH